MVGVTSDDYAKANLGQNRFAYVAGETGKWKVTWNVAHITQVPDCGHFAT
jgi:hypothetical protein